MPKRGAKAGVGNKDSSGHGVYGFIRDMIREGKNAQFEDNKGRYLLNWSSALKRYAIYKSEKNPQFKSKNINRRKASNGLRAALLNIYKKDGAKEYKGSKKVNDKEEVIERQFQMPSKVFQSLFGSKVELSDDSDQKTSSTSSEEREEGDKDSGVLSTQGPIEERMDVEMASGNKDSSGHDVTSSTSSENDLDMLMKVALAKKPLSLEDSSGKSEDILEVFPNRGPIEERVEGDNDSDILGIFPNSGPMEEMLARLMEVALAVKEQEEGYKDSGFLSTRGPIEEQMGVEMASDILEIFPNNGPIEGGSPFVLVFGQSLEVESARVEFGGKAATDLPRVNDFNLIGRIPASDTPGNVTVTVRSSTGRILGKTDFCYNDRGTSSELGPSEVTNFLL